MLISLDTVSNIHSSEAVLLVRQRIGKTPKTYFNPSIVHQHYRSSFLKERGRSFLKERGRSRPTTAGCFCLFASFLILAGASE
jgi:hypothetical protein